MSPFAELGFEDDPQTDLGPKAAAQLSAGSLCEMRALSPRLELLNQNLYRDRTLGVGGTVELGSREAAAWMQGGPPTSFSRAGGEAGVAERQGKEQAAHRRGKCSSQRHYGR